MDGGGWILDQCIVLANFAFGTRFLEWLENVLLFLWLDIVKISNTMEKFEISLAFVAQNGHITERLKNRERWRRPYRANGRQPLLTSPSPPPLHCTGVDLFEFLICILCQWSPVLRWTLKTLNPFWGFIFSDTDSFKYCIVLTWTLSIIIFKLSLTGDL